MKRITFLAAIISGFTLFGAKSALALNDFCNFVTGAPVTGECQVTTSHAAPGPFTIDRTLHIFGTGKLVTGATGININITGGDFVMDSGALIDGNVAGASNTGGPITLTLGAGKVDMKKGSIIRSDSGSGGAIVITTVDSHTANIDGLVESVGSISGTGGAHQRPGGGTIRIVAGCALTVSDNGKVSSRGADPGADLVHLAGCSVVIDGLVESTGPGHVNPDSPANQCNNDPVAHPPGSSSFFTACVEIWSATTVLIDGSANAAPTKGQVNADVGQGGGNNGRGWIDIYARQDITIRGMADPLVDPSAPPTGGGCSGHVNTISGAHPGCSAADHYAVHANGGLGVNTDDGGFITIMSETGRVLTSNQAVQAASTASGGTGGDVRVEAAGDISFGKASIQAKGAASGHGGHITARSYAGAVTGGPLLGELNAAGDSPPDGTVALASCTNPSTTYLGLVVPVLTPQVVCGPAQPTLPGFVNLPASTCQLFCQFLNCGDKFGSPLEDALLPGYAAGQRGGYNTDASTCVPVGYLFTNTILSNDTVNLKWDTSSQPKSAFSYTMNWRLRSVDGAGDPTPGWTSVRPLVAWLESPPGTPIFIPGLVCLSTNLPAPYGTLQAAISASQSPITVNATAALPPVPFPAVIGSERMQVTNVSGSTWTVVRGTGNLGADAAGHLANAVVMSTPLPILIGALPPPYVVGTQAQMCIAEHSWMSVGSDSNGAFVEYLTNVIDNGDGRVRLP